MFRTFVCTAVALLVFASFGLADDQKKKKKKKAGAAIPGQITKIDAEKGTFTLTVQLKKKVTLDKEFTVTDKTTVTAVEGDNRVELKVDKVADLLKKEPFKTGANAS